jgi:hypothetical protein
MLPTIRRLANDTPLPRRPLNDAFAALADCSGLQRKEVRRACRLLGRPMPAEGEPHREVAPADAVAEQLATLCEFHRGDTDDHQLADPIEGVDRLVDNNPTVFRLTTESGARFMVVVAAEPTV